MITHKFAKKYPATVSGAMRYAHDKHQGQKRKRSESPYIVHPLAVMQIVSTLSHDKEVLMAAVLHDTVEDTDATHRDIVYLFGPRVASLVNLLTKQKNETKDQSVERALQDVDSALIKCADRINNLCDGMLHMEKEWLSRYLPNTAHMSNMLQLKLKYQFYDDPTKEERLKILYHALTVHIDEAKRLLEA